MSDILTALGGVAVIGLLVLLCVGAAHNLGTHRLEPDEPQPDESIERRSRRVQ